MSLFRVTPQNFLALSQCLLRGCACSPGPNIEYFILGGAISRSSLQSTITVVSMPNFSMRWMRSANNTKAKWIYMLAEKTVIFKRLHSKPLPLSNQPQQATTLCHSLKVTGILEEIHGAFMAVNQSPQLLLLLFQSYILTYKFPSKVGLHWPLSFPLSSDTHLYYQTSFIL